MRSIVWLVRWRKIFVRSKPVMLVRMSWTSLRMKTVLGSASKPTKVFEEKKFCSTFVTRRLESTEKTTRTAARPNQWTKHSINDERKTSSTKGRTGDEKEEIRRRNNGGTTKIRSFSFAFFFFLDGIARRSEFIRSFVIDGINVPLIQIDEENQICNRDENVPLRNFRKRNSFYHRENIRCDTSSACEWRRRTNRRWTCSTLCTSSFAKANAKQIWICN